MAAHLFQLHYHGDALEALRETMRCIRGSYALGVVTADAPDELVCARQDSPLILGLGEGETMIASDIPAILAVTRRYVVLEDGQAARVRADGVEITDIYGRPVEPRVQTVNWDISAAEKGGYRHFMMKEIMEQPKAVRDTVSPRLRDGLPDLAAEGLDDSLLKNAGHIHITACGSALHAGLVGKAIIEKLARVPVTAQVASEFRYGDPIIGPGDLCIVISQSGETADTLAALREAKRKGAKTIAIVNVVSSSAAREADAVLYTWAGPEIAVATTKAYTTQMVVLHLLGLYFGDVLGTVDLETYTAMVRGIEALPGQMEAILSDTDAIRSAAKALAGHEHIFFIGRNLDYALSLEGSLKLKEISYIHSEAYASGELKHGTISLIQPGTPVIAVATYMPLFDKALSNVVEVQARGASVLALTTEDGGEELRRHVDTVLTVPRAETMLLPQLGVLPLQLLAYYAALERGCDIDKPRNLAKSVTVE